MAPLQAAPLTAPESGLEYEFSAELDEFLEVCVDEHGEDWEAIAADFLDIATGLDEELFMRANEFFSPAVLKQRWLELCRLDTSRVAQSDIASEEPAAHTIEPVCQYGVPSTVVPSCMDSVPPCRPHQSRSLTAHALADVQRNLPSTMDLGDEVNALLDELSDDSDDGDFAQTRRAVKTSSSTLVSEKRTAGAMPVRKTAGALFCAPQPRAWKWTQEVRVNQSSPKAAPQWNFTGTEFEIVEDLSDELREIDQNVKQDESDEAGLPLRILKSLLEKAPHGECSSYTWLNSTREWPRLQVLVGTPEFVHREGELKALVNVGRLQSVLAEEELVYAEVCQKRAEMANLNTADFIRETEKRRQMVGCFGGGEFLQSPSARS